MMCLICSLKPACEAGEAGGDGKTKTWCRNLISAVPCCAYAHMPGQSDYGTFDRRHQAERETARYIVLRSTQYWRVLILKDTAKPCRMKKRNVRPYLILLGTSTTPPTSTHRSRLRVDVELWSSTSFVLSPLKSHLVFLDAMAKTSHLDLSWLHLYS